MIYLIFFIGLLFGLGTGLLAGYTYAASLIRDHAEGAGTYQCPTCQQSELLGNA